MELAVGKFFCDEPKEIFGFMNTNCLHKKLCQRWNVSLLSESQTFAVFLLSKGGFSL